MLEDVNQDEHGYVIDADHSQVERPNRQTSRRHPSTMTQVDNNEVARNLSRQAQEYKNNTLLQIQEQVAFAAKGHSNKKLVSDTGLQTQHLLQDVGDKLDEIAESAEGTAMHEVMLGSDDEDGSIQEQLKIVEDEFAAVDQIVFGNLRRITSEPVTPQTPLFTWLKKRLFGK